jgi:hypothetical protein
MDKATFNKYVEDRYLNQMEYYSKAAARNQKKYRQFQWILIILSALTPVLAALNGFNFGSANKPFVVNLSLIVVIVSSVVAILTTGLKTFNYQELWITYRTTYEKLKPEIHYYTFNVGEYEKPEIDKESLFVSRVEALLNGEHNQWPAAKKMQEEQSKAVDENASQLAPGFVKNKEDFSIQIKEVEQKATN